MIVFSVAVNVRASEIAGIEVRGNAVLLQDTGRVRFAVLRAILTAPFAVPL